ncbi:MAG TPA: ribonuclease P protein component [Candidatus Saccharimonadales bacterium]|jgi:ribonuclease P protein component|nr:ribonuclease P protein component [Candidatus Saccharimonadales bacterium]
MLSFANRFHGHGSLRYVYKNGQAIRSRLITIKYTHNPHRKDSRFAVVVSKKVHKSAVGRNRMRRRIYEIVRQELPNIPRAHDVAIMIFSSEVITLPNEELKDIIRQLFAQADLHK